MILLSHYLDHFLKLYKHYLLKGKSILKLKFQVDLNYLN